MVVWFRRLAALSCAAALMLSGGALPSFSAVAEEEGADAAWYKEGTYAAYLQDHRDAGRPEADLRIPAADYQEGTAQGVSSAQGFLKPRRPLWLWKREVPSPGRSRWSRRVCMPWDFPITP